MKVCYNFHDLEEVVERDYRVEEHEERFGDSEDIFHVPCGSWFEISNAVITNISNGASSQWR